MAFRGSLADKGGRRAAWIDSFFVDHSVFRMVWDNLGEVVPDKLYRCNHPTPGRLKRLKEKLGLVTLINLRGHRKCGSDALSREAAQHLGLIHIDMAFESRGAPHRDRIERFYDIYRNLKTPALMHCKSGADRAGLASGLAVMFEGGSAEQAMEQLSVRYGHFNRSATGILDAFFRLYQQTAEGRMPFMEWVSTEYDEHALRASFKSHKLSGFLNDYVLRRE